MDHKLEAKSRDAEIPPTGKRNALYAYYYWFFMNATRPP